MLSPRDAISKESGLACVPALISCGILTWLKPTTLQPDTHTDSLLLSPTADARKERDRERERGGTAPALLTRTFPTPLERETETKKVERGEKQGEISTRVEKAFTAG